MRWNEIHYSPPNKCISAYEFIIRQINKLPHMELRRRRNLTFYVFTYVTQNILFISLWFLLFIICLYVIYKNYATK